MGEAHSGVSGGVGGGEHAGSGSGVRILTSFASGLLTIVICGLLWLEGRPIVGMSLLGAAGVLALLGAVLFVKRPPKTLTITPWFKTNHYLQAIVQVGLFSWWFVGWPRVGDQIPLILVQLVFALSLDMLLGWWRWGQWRAGFGVVPPTLSINLFLWFDDSHFYLQLAMVTVGIASKELIKWTRNGVRIHIFNPSAFALTVFSLGLIFTGAWDITHGEEISTYLGTSPYMYVAMAVASLLVQWTHPVILITISSVLTVVGLGAIYFLITGTYLFIDTAIPIAVFLGMLLLVTDPTTTPHTHMGRLLTGVLYGISIVVFYIWFKAIGVPAFFDKLLILPVLNLITPLIERVAERQNWDRWWRGLATAKAQRLHQVVWVVVFLAVVPRLEAHPGHDPEFWRTACAEGRYRGCQSLADVYFTLCKGGVAEGCFNEGVMLDEGGELTTDIPAALLRYERACRLDFAPGCLSFGLAFDFGRGVETDTVKAVDALTEGCLLDHHDSCTALLNAEARGEQLPPELVDVLDAACPAHGEASCNAAAKTLQLTGQTGRLAALFERRCEAKHWASCANLGLMKLRGDGVRVDRQAAIELHRLACENGLEPACARLKQLSTMR